MKFSRLLLFAALLFLLPASVAAQAPAHLRIANAIPNTEQVTLKMEKTDDRSGMKLVVIPNRDSSAYMPLEPGEYRVTLVSDGEELTDETFLLGSGDRFTLLTFGLVPGDGYERVEPRNPLAWFHRAFGNEAARAVQGQQPRMQLLADDLMRDRAQAHVRIVHLAPGYSPVGVYLRQGRVSAPKELARSVSYASSSAGIVSVEPGDYELYVQAPESAEGQFRKPMKLKSGALTTIVIVGGPSDTSDSGELGVMVMSTPLSDRAR